MLHTLIFFMLAVCPLYSIFTDVITSRQCSDAKQIRTNKVDIDI